jgi:hypothetical protein
MRASQLDCYKGGCGRPGLRPVRRPLGKDSLVTMLRTLGTE